jgi:hemerythrin-like metal-binding protein
MSGQAAGSFLVWRAELSVGHARLDRQHQTIFALINNLFAAMQEGRGEEVLARVIRELEGYVLTHLADEEALLEACRYPALEEHRRHDRQLAGLTQQVGRRLARGPYQVEAREVLHLGRSWLEHIRDQDHLYMGCIARLA